MFGKFIVVSLCVEHKDYSEALMLVIMKGIVANLFESHELLLGLEIIEDKPLSSLHALPDNLFELRLLDYFSEPYQRMFSFIASL